MTNGWHSSRLKHLVRSVVEKAGLGEDRPYVGLDAIASWTGEINLDASETTDDSMGNRFNSGDVLFGKLRPYLAKVAAPKFSGQCSGEALVLRPQSNIDTRFLRYRLVEAGTIDAINASTYGAKMPRASWDFIGNLRFSVPDLPTQKAIADFLDRETARIDQLIEKKQRLIELLADRSDQQIAALIETSCQTLPTQGLRWLVRVRSGDFISNEEIEKMKTSAMPVPVVGGNGIMAYTDKSNALPKTIVVGRVGALCGNVHFIRSKSWITDNALIVRIVSKSVEPEFLVALLRAANLNQKASKSAQPLITGETVKSLKVRIPSQHTQNQICDQIARMTKGVHELSYLVETSTKRLGEFRSALITAAVTGQIDVSTWGKCGETDRRLDKIEEDMTIGRNAVDGEPMEARA